MPTTLTNGIQLPDKGSVDWYNSMQSNYNLIDTHLGNTDTHVTAEDKANWNSKQGSLSQAQLDAIAQVATNTSDIATLQSGKADVSHTHSSSDITDIGDYATKQYVDNSINGLVDNAPAALDTLKELSTALNDDANFASTVTTALGAKANSADLATVATSGDYNDLDNLPTIPTKTSDLTNDSNFVDTSNSAVSSGITSAKVTSYDSHVADTDIHVTTADKTKWNNGVSQSYVFRYSGTAVVPNSTVAYSTIDNTDNIKLGDKILDVDGKLFEITAVDTTNQTVTVGSALIDLALDGNVVHTSGNETVSGTKTFSATPYIYNSDSTENSPNMLFRNSKYSVGDTTDTGEQRIIYADKNGAWTGSISSYKNIAGTQYLTFTVYSKDNNNANISSTIHYYLAKNGDRYFTPYEDSLSSLGSTTKRWKSFNGLTPSSLGMPNVNINSFVDISGYFTNTGTGEFNTYPVTANGWIFLRLSTITGCQTEIYDSSDNKLYAMSTSGSLEQIMIPVVSGVTLKTQWATGSAVTVNIARFIPCQGNI